MKRTLVAFGIFAAMAASVAAGVHRIPLDTSDDRVESPLRVPLERIGTLTPLKDPVWVDLFTGRIYAFPKKDWIADADGVTYMNVPAYDSPCVLTERSVVMDLPAPTRPVLEVFEATRREAEAENAARQERSALSDGVKPRTAADNLDI